LVSLSRMKYIFLCFIIILPKQVLSETNNIYFEPFFSYVHEPESTELILRPFFSYQKTKNFFSLDIFYPLIRYRKSERRKHLSVFPLIERSNDYNEFFLIFWGKTENGEKYGGIFPIYGQFKHRFGKKKILFFLWPIYTYSQEEDFKTYRFLFPFFTIHRGEERSAFKFLPFFGYDFKKKEFKKYYFLWPIFIYQKTKLNSSEPKTYFSIFPFYISEKTPLSHSYTFLWPFFKFYRYKDYRHYDCPWPFIGWTKSDKFFALNILPLFRYEKGEDIKRLYLAYPFYKRQIEYEKNKKIITDYFIFVNRYERHYTKGKIILKLIKFWPIFYYKSEKNKMKTYFPAILPVEEPGFERNLAPLLRLYYSERIQKSIYTCLFWGIYQHKKGKEKEFYQFFPFFKWEKQKNKQCFSLFLGMIQIIKSEEKKYLKLFYFLKF